MIGNIPFVTYILNNLSSVTNILKCIMICFLGIIAVTSLRASLFICVQSRRSNSVTQEPVEIQTCRVVLPDGRLAKANLPRRNALSSIPQRPQPRSIEILNYSAAETTKNSEKVSITDNEDVIIETDFQKVDLEDFQLKDISSDSSSGYSTEENQNLTIRLSGRLPVSNFGMIQYITKSLYIETFATTKISELKIQIAKG